MGRLLIPLEGLRSCWFAFSKAFLGGTEMGGIGQASQAKSKVEEAMSTPEADVFRGFLEVGGGGFLTPSVSFYI